MATFSFDLTELEQHLPLRPGQEREWRLQTFPGWEARFPTIVATARMLLHSPKVLQQTKYSLVLLIEHQGQKFIAKRSLNQERRLWPQCTSLYRKGEGARTMRTLRRIYDCGLPVPEPVLVLEKKRLGFTLASWSVYRYLEGETCGFEHSAQIARTLRMMHDKGWVHRDPHVWNFLCHQGQMRILDCARARPWSSKYARMYDVVLLDKCSPGSAGFYGVPENDPVYRLARFQNLQLQRWRRIKRVIRFWRKERP